MLSCAGSELAKGRYPFQGVLPTVYNINNFINELILNGNRPAHYTYILNEVLIAVSIPL
jgi:protocatechuate 3,4-dioxygenase beta subunit